MARSLLNPRDESRDIKRKKINRLSPYHSSSPVTGTSVTLDEDDYYVLVDDDTAGSTVTVSLPAAADSIGIVYHIKKLGTTADVIIDGNGSETIDGMTTLTISIQYDSPMIYCDGTAWYII